jgi:hypothetical protein
MEPDRAAVVAGACVVLHNAMAWNVPLMENAAADDDDDDGDLHVPRGMENNLHAEAATVRAYLARTHFS